MTAERGGEEEPTRITLQQQPSIGREDGWKNIRKVREAAVLNALWNSFRKLVTSKDDESGREVRPQLGVRQRRGRRTPEEH